MSSPQPATVVSYLDILFVFIIMATVTVLYILFRLLIFKFLISKERAAAFFLSRLNLPAVLLLITFCFKISGSEGRLLLRPEF